MTGNSTAKLIPAYFEQSPEVQLFFSGMFRTPAGNYHATEDVELDVVRSGRQVAVAVSSLASGYNHNSEELYTNKRFKPPVFKESFVLSAFDLLKRAPGQDPFANVDVRASLTGRFFRVASKVEAKIRRAIELQAAQVMQTGVVTLVNSDGDAVYTIDYKPKSAHFPTAGTSWASATLAQKIDNILALCNLIAANGKVRPDQIIMGEKAFENLINTAGFTEIRFNALRANLGSITRMSTVGNGALYRGSVEIGNYALDVFTYPEQYTDIETGAELTYMHTGKVIVRASEARLDGTFGAVPNIGRLLGAQGNQVSLPLPGRLSGSGMDMFTNVWLSPDGEALNGGVASRPLMIPTQIDSFGCLDTQLT